MPSFGNSLPISAAPTLRKARDTDAATARRILTGDILAVSNSRLGFNIVTGSGIFIGFATEEEARFCSHKRMSYSERMRTKIDGLKRKGFEMNYRWI
ncbi:hypothetical protein E5D57_009307 [Metarhizium anisopliae]|nr:hypothetical protein E5D57_009307 [Metarhizium anisopliae]